MSGSAGREDIDSASVERELRALDDFLRAMAGPAARIDRQWLGSPARQIEVDTGSGITAGIVIAAMSRTSVGGAPRAYIVVPFAWADVDGERWRLRSIPQWTVELSSDKGRAAAVQSIQQAFRHAMDADPLNMTPEKAVELEAPQQPHPRALNP